VTRDLEPQVQRLQATLNVEHATQRLMLERLGLEWPLGEPFYSIIEAEIRRLRVALDQRLKGS
jgi:hypothetical protein